MDLRRARNFQERLITPPFRLHPHDSPARHPAALVPPSVLFCTALQVVVIKAKSRTWIQRLTAAVGVSTDWGRCHSFCAFGFFPYPPSLGEHTYAHRMFALKTELPATTASHLGSGKTRSVTTTKLVVAFNLISLSILPQGDNLRLISKNNHPGLLAEVSS